MPSPQSRSIHEVFRSQLADDLELYVPGMGRVFRSAAAQWKLEPQKAFVQITQDESGQFRFEIGAFVDDKLVLDITVSPTGLAQTVLPAKKIAGLHYSDTAGVTSLSIHTENPDVHIVYTAYGDVERESLISFFRIVRRGMP